MSAAGGPDYRRVADDLKSKISSGEIAVGEPIPSTRKLMAAYGVSSTVVRQAVKELQNEGVARGHIGKAVFVEAKPEEIAKERTDVQDIAKEVANVREELSALSDRVGVLQAHLMDLYARVGEDFPEDDAKDGRPRRRKTGT